MAPSRANRMTAIAATLAVVVMVGASFAAVPLYRIFCQVTGFGGTTRVAAAPIADGTADPDARVMTVSLLGNVNPALPWSFAPVKSKITLRVGENVLAYYRATNLSDEAVTGVATFNVTPHKAGPYFVKVDCFCFTRQTLAPGESVDMPVSFYVDPELARDHKLNDVTDIALSYTFFRAPTQDDGPEIASAEPVVRAPAVPRAMSSRGRE